MLSRIQASAFAERPRWLGASMLLLADVYDRASTLAGPAEAALHADDLAQRDRISTF